MKNPVRLAVLLGMLSACALMLVSATASAGIVTAKSMTIFPGFDCQQAYNRFEPQTLPESHSGAMMRGRGIVAGGKIVSIFNTIMALTCPLRLPAQSSIQQIVVSGSKHGASGAIMAIYLVTADGLEDLSKATELLNKAFGAGDVPVNETLNKGLLSSGTAQEPAYLFLTIGPPYNPDPSTLDSLDWSINLNSIRIDYSVSEQQKDEETTTDESNTGKESQQAIAEGGGDTLPAVTPKTGETTLLETTSETTTRASDGGGGMCTLMPMAAANPLGLVLLLAAAIPLARRGG